MTFPLVLFCLAFAPMLIEAWRSEANARGLRAAGAIEPSGDVYPVMRLAYPACFMAMLIEAWVRGSSWTASAAAGAVIFAVAKTVKYWAIFTLGSRWTFRVLVPPQSNLTTRGPYRFLRHPNYAGVLGELIGFALLAGAPVSGAASVVGFGMLVITRIRLEERALGLRK